MVKNSKIEIRITFDEKEKIKKYCDVKGVSVSSYIMSLVHDDFEKSRQEPDEIIKLKEIRKQLLEFIKDDSNSDFYKLRVKTIESELRDKGYF